jgi:exonuclease VII small subunit
MPLDYTLTVADDEVYSFNALDNKIDNVLAVSLERYDQACSKYDEASGRYTQIVTDVNTTVNNQTNAVNILVENTLEESNTKYNTAVENLNTATNNYNTATNNYNNAVVNYQRAEEKLTESADKYDKTYSVLANYNQVRPLFVETIDECIDIRKLYILPDNHIYAYMLSKEVIQNSEVVSITWVNGVRLNETTGAESSSEPYSASDFISIKPDTNYIISTASNYLLDMGVCYYDKDDKFLEYRRVWDQGTATDCTGKWIELEIPTNAVSFRLRAFHILDGKQTERLAYVTIYRSDYVSSDAYEWLDTGHTFIATDYEDRIIELEQKVTDLESRLLALEGLALSTE